MADPTLIQCTEACTVTVVHQIALPPLQLTAEQGAQISSAILLVWAAGWGIRALIQTLRNSAGNNSTSED